MPAPLGLPTGVDESRSGYGAEPAAVDLRPAMRLDMDVEVPEAALAAVLA